VTSHVLFASFVSDKGQLIRHHFTDLQSMPVEVEVITEQVQLYPFYVLLSIDDLIDLFSTRSLFIPHQCLING
jgi:hypothetical protein